MAVLCAGCGNIASKQQRESRLPVFAGVPPLAYLVEQIGGRHVRVDALIQPGQDPHTFEPTPHQVVALGEASLFFEIDMPFENVLLEKVQANNPRLKTIDVTEGIHKLPMEFGCCDHDDPDADHHEPSGEPDPHVWLSPPLLKSISKKIAGALCEADPSHKQDYQKNLALLENRIDALHESIKKLLAPYNGRAFYVFHPGFAYFAAAYGLRQEAVEIAGRDPTPKQLLTLLEHARHDRVSVIFAQPQSAPQSAEVVAQAIGGRVVFINGLDKNVLADIKDIAEKIENSMKH